MYQACFDTRFFQDANNVYFRKGVWNTLDGIIPKDGIEQPQQFFSFLSSLGQENSTDFYQTLTNSDKNLVADLIEHGFIQEHTTKQTDAYTLLTGQRYITEPDEVHFDLVCDTQAVYAQIQYLESTYGYQYVQVDRNTTRALTDINFLSKTDSLVYEKHMSFLQQSLHATWPKLILLQKPNLPLLRNLNRCVQSQTPLFIGLIDGPFLIFVSVCTGQTACFDCFEQHMLASLQDHSLYQRFADVPFGPQSEDIYNLHMQTLLHIGLQEVFSWCLLKMSRLMGRAYMIYLPTYEVHCNDIVRLSSCPTCGFIARESNASHNLCLHTLLSDCVEASA